MSTSHTSSLDFDDIDPIYLFDGPVETLLKYRHVATCLQRRLAIGSRLHSLVWARCSEQSGASQSSRGPSQQMCTRTKQPITGTQWLRHGAAHGISGKTLSYYPGILWAIPGHSSTNRNDFFSAGFRRGVEICCIFLASPPAYRKEYISIA